MARERKQHIEPDFSLKLTETLKEKDYHQKVDGSTDDGKKDLPFLPFRFAFTGAPNLRGQSTSQNYKTFLGKQKV